MYAELVTLIAAAADHLDKWTEPDARSLTELEQVVADLTHMARFNWQKDLASSVVRTSQIFREIPSRGRYSSVEVWDALHIAAFGSTFREHVVRFALPMALLSSRWGRMNQRGQTILPTINVEELFAETMANDANNRAHLSSICAERDALRQRILSDMRADGVPAPPACFYRTPFVRLDDSMAVALSPWIAREQLKAGVWARFRSAVQDSKEWLRTFGDVFELWARRIAHAASRKRRFRGTVNLSEKPGTGEIEDVVVKGQNAAALFSVKASLMSEVVARGHRSRSAVIDWYERFLFGEANPRNKDYRAAGAVRLLDANIGRIRRSETALPGDIYILPVLVSFDDLCETSMLNRWIDVKCAEYGLLSQANVAPLAIVEPGEYDGLFALAARGTSVIEILRLKASPHWREQNMDALLHQMCSSPEDLRAPEFAADFEELTEGVWKGLFGKPPPTSDATSSTPAFNGAQGRGTAES